MTKPKMAEGSKFLGDALVEDKRFRSISCDKDGDICIETDDSLEYVSALDVIRVAVEGGPLRPLWDAAAKVATTAVAMREAFREFEPLNDERIDLHRAFVDAVSNLCRVIDDMKEPTP